jgi:CRISPR/Cas system CMR subunit Cmr4 (Cas7 group RAMP superfamily)
MLDKMSHHKKDILSNTINMLRTYFQEQHDQQDVPAWIGHLVQAEDTIMSYERGNLSEVCYRARIKDCLLIEGLLQKFANKPMC